MSRIFSPKKFSAGARKFNFNFNWKKIGKYISYMALAGFLFVAGVCLYFYKDLPSPDNLNNRVIAESTKIYDRTGTHILYDVHGEEKRTQIPYSEMPETVRYATISLEDQSFYSNHGIEIKSMLRAAINDVLHRGASQGGSTITQQLVKQSILSSEKTFTRKIKEAILAIELEQKFSKDEILAMYLNQIPYGSNAYGIEAAAQTFFGKHASELDLAESSFLASLPQAPTYYSPYGSNRGALKGRQEYCLKQMLSLGYITQDQYNEATGVDIFSEIKPDQENINAPHFVMYIKQYLEKKYGQDTVEQGGLNVYTTLDWDKQQAAETAVKSGAANNVKYKASNAALVSMDPKTGQVLAMVGSKDYFDTSIDGQVNVALSNRQPGSSFKPYVYLTAFIKGFTPETQLWDVDTNFSTDSGQTYAPHDYDGKNRGPLEMKDALAMSLNIPAVETLYLAGVKDSIDTAHKMGIPPTSLSDPSRLGLSLVLGGGEVTLLDHVDAYSTFATGGIHHNIVSILKIQDSKGNILEQYQPSDGNRVIDEKYISMIDYIMSTNDLRAPIFGNNNPLAFSDRPVAAKTGTTNEWRDGWTIGYTPSIVTGVWAGNNDNSIMAQGADGIFVAAPIWRGYMDQVLKNYSIEKFPEYKQQDTGKGILDGKLDATQELKVCKIPGKKNDTFCLANDNCPDSLVEKDKFSNNHSILYYVNKDDPQGDPPKNPSSDPQFKSWEKAVSDWTKGKKDYSHDSPPTNDCSSDDFKNLKPSVSISSPSDGDTITSSSFTIKASVDSPLDIKKITFTVNGSDACSGSKDSCDYSVSDSDKNSSLNIKVTAEDGNGNDDSNSISVKTNIP